MEVVNECGIRPEHNCSSRGVLAKECFMFFSNTLKDVRALAKCCVCVLRDELANVREKLYGFQLTQRVLAEVSCPAKIKVLTDAISISRVSLLTDAFASPDILLLFKPIAIASSMAKYLLFSSTGAVAGP